MRFGLLGPVEIRTDTGESLDPGGERPRTLLALLLLSTGRGVSVERLIEGLYGDEPPAGAANALQSQVSRLRRRLQVLGVRIESVPFGYRLDVDPADTDVHLFQNAVRAGRTALAAGEHGRAAALLREGLALWRGSALADLTPVPCVTAEARRLEETRLDAREDLAAAELGLGGGTALVPELRELIAAQPLRERPYGLLMRALRAAGRTAEGLAVYEDARHTLAEHLGADPSPELAALHLELLRPEGAAAPRPVPARLTSFVGREDALQQLGGLLRTARLVTLTGPGGAGKTRLAQEGAGRWPGAVCYVELAPVPDAAGLPYAVLAALGVRESGFPDRAGGADALDRLLAALAALPGLLLVLDNCEHLVDGAAALAVRILGAHPQLRVLATSREALAITGETLVTVEPLGEPAAVRLFAERAAAVRPGIDLRAGAEGHTRAVRLCAALDGLPLALELAAARLRTLTVEELADRLGDRLGGSGSGAGSGDDRFRLLSRGDRTKEPRHRTLRAVVEWSWELLDEAEQELARRFTVFAGGATADAVQEVCAVVDAEDVLTSLVEKSFVTVTDGRYRMLETIRAFCAEQLGTEEREFRAAHAAYFLNLAEEAEPHLRGATQLHWLDRIEAEHTDLLAAVRHGGTATSLRLIACLSWYAPLRGRSGELAQAARAVLERTGQQPPEGLVEEYVLCLLAAVDHRAGAAVTVADEELTAHADRLIAGLIGTLRRPHVLTLWSLASGPRTSTGAPPETEAAYGDSSPWAAALLRMGRAYQHLFAGRPGPAEEDFTDALTGFRATGDRWGIANSLDPLATFAHWRSDHTRALELLDEALVLVTELRAPEETADMLMRRGHVLLHAGRADEAVALFTRSAQLSGAVGVPDKAAGALRGLGDAARIAGDTARARAHYETALAGGTDSWFGTGETLRVLLGLGRTALAEGDRDLAEECFAQAAVLARNQPGRLILAELAEARAEAGPPRRTAELLGEAEAHRGAPQLGDLDVVRTMQAARAALTPDAYRAAYERGRRARA
ncbi:SARP family transcriptional regulator [Streptomyces spiroverticillatus]|uniref:SARP family transcriptional regulator n=1 Tax=Streptomyces finlayi TaxID=67296 RepID=A0A919CCJ5_9ACTN|nr:BTAD domain-containing putative transcriptional regulator [Streptomyces finlayi]GHA24929.1 SARP family transcriptional regulator [Streptomyces spiroverticillatus]GHD05658.1 SARP family transcriptional regulator [Streptomyces finlayi]